MTKNLLQSHKINSTELVFLMHWNWKLKLKLNLELEIQKLKLNLCSANFLCYQHHFVTNCDQSSTTNYVFQTLSEKRIMFSERGIASFNTKIVTAAFEAR